jgi:quinol monooxygenase YgiN
VIVRTWSGRVPIYHADAFRRHLAATGVADYRAREGLVDVALWRRDEDGWAIFTLVSTWRDMDSVRAYAGDEPTRAVHYPGDDAFGLVADTFATHHEIVEGAP